MIAMMTYQTAQHLDKIDTNHFNMVVLILVGVIILGMLILCTDFGGFGVFFMVGGMIGLVGLEIVAMNVTPRTVKVARHELPGLQRQVENLRGQRLELVHKNGAKIAIKFLNQQIADTQSKITKYNNLIIANDDND